MGRKYANKKAYHQVENENQKTEIGGKPIMKKVYEAGSISTCYEMKLFFATIRELFPIIDDFICAQGNELVNEKICHNECYSIRFGRRKTVVYLNGE